MINTVHNRRNVELEKKKEKKEDQKGRERWGVSSVVLALKNSNSN